MLSPFSRLYGAITKLRAYLYKRDLLKSSSLGVPTISVGNITVGGTGKTPLVATITEILAERGAKVCILTRGYGRKDPKKRVLVSDGETILVDDAKLSGDEPLELAKKLLGKAIIVADADRVAAANWVREKFDVTAFVLDDAFQHFKAKRDLDIVTIDATNPFGNEKLVPAGILREPLKNLERADAIVITRANLSDNVERLEAEIRHYDAVCPIFVSRNKTSSIIALKDFGKNDAEIDEPHTSERVFAFCALGNPENFFEQLRREGFDLSQTKAFADHYSYSQKDVLQLENEANELGSKVLVTTAKDAVKLIELKFKMPCYVINSEMIFDDQDLLRELVCSILGD